MSREVDLRDLDAYENIAANVEDVGGFEPGGDFIEQALEFAKLLAPSGVEDDEKPLEVLEFASDPQIARTSTGAAAVYLQQQASSIPIFQATQTVSFGPDGALEGSKGQLADISQKTAMLPELSVEQAVLKAAQHVAVPDSEEQEGTDSFGSPIELTPVAVSGFEPTIVASFRNLPEQPAVLERGPFGEEIKANLTWFPVAPKAALRLAWEVVITMPNFEDQFYIIVDARDGNILYSTSLINSVTARGNVFLVDGEGQREMVTFPLPWTAYGLEIPKDLPPEMEKTPNPWVEEDGTTGYSTIAHKDEEGPTVQGVEEADKILIFDPADPSGDDQSVLNAFYYACFMHDFFYLLGFRERDGNFQQVNVAVDDGGIPGDRVDVRVFEAPVPLTASMSPSVDGSSPKMTLGLHKITNRPTALDSSVVFHEFFHGVSNRLVGGPRNAYAMVVIQSKGLSEGLSDFAACTINNSVVIGSWVTGNPNGMRLLRYDDSFPAGTNNFGSLGKDRYTTPHNIGEIWCAALLEIGRRIGPIRNLQLVVEALKLCPANPSFLDMRDAVLKALNHELGAGLVTSEQHSADQSAMWTVFAKFGMGPTASCQLASLRNIRPDFRTPAPVTPLL